ncbi:unnamed protein product [Diplocarpon coronariae]
MDGLRGCSLDEARGQASRFRGIPSCPTDFPFPAAGLVERKSRCARFGTGDTRDGGGRAGHERGHGDVKVREEADRGIKVSRYIKVSNYLKGPARIGSRPVQVVVHGDILRLSSPSSSSSPSSCGLVHPSSLAGTASKLSPSSIHHPAKRSAATNPRRPRREAGDAADTPRLHSCSAAQPPPTSPESTSAVGTVRGDLPNLRSLTSPNLAYGDASKFRFPPDGPILELGSLGRLLLLSLHQIAGCVA